MLTLFGNLESGNVHKVQMILHRLRLPFRRVDVSQTRGEPKSPQFLNINPIGKVPALRLEDGDVLTESGAILYFFAQGSELWPAGGRAQAEVLRWMFFEQYSHEPALAVMRYLVRFAGGREKHSARLEELTPKAHAALTAMETRLGQGEFVAGETCTIADLALYPYTAWSNEAGIDLAGYPAIGRWLDRVGSEPRFLPLLEEGAEETWSFERCFRA